MANKIITVHFTEFGNPRPGLTPTIDIYMLDPQNPAINTPVVTSGLTTEIGGGWYRYDFTAYSPANNYVFTFDGGMVLDANDRYKYGGNDSYVEDISSGVWDEQLTDHVETGTAGLMLQQVQADMQTVLLNEVTLTSLLNTLLKYERNRTELNPAAATLTIYDDDCITPLTVFDLKDFNGMPSVLEVCQRVPQGGAC